MKMIGKYSLALAGLLLSCSAYALQISVSLVTEDGAGQSVGEVTVISTPYGILLTPHLTGLTPGLHGMHIHEAPDCAHMGNSAKGHFDPKHTGKHHGPYNDDGHLGDLPALFVDNKGDASLPVIAPRLTLRDIEGHSLMIHKGGDNYSDHPANGGGGDRVACGIIPIEVP